MIVERIDGKRAVALAPLELGDVSDAYVAWLNDPVVTRFTEVVAGETPDSVRSYVQRTLASTTDAIWRILHEGTHVGNIRLSAIRWKHFRAEVALIIGSRQHWSRGIASEAVGILTEFAFTRLKLHKLCAGILSPNVASRRCFEKAGYVEDAVLRQHAWFEGAFCDVIQMARLSTHPSTVHSS